MASPFNTSSIPHHTHLKNKGLRIPYSTASSVKVHDTRQPHEPQSSPHTQTGSYNPLFAVVPQRHSFNPRSRVGSDVMAFVGLLLLQVSIHAPAWGATHDCRCTDYRIDVSIHAPAWGATLREQICAVEQQVSIHAPTWGVTSSSMSLNSKR